MAAAQLASAQELQADLASYAGFGDKISGGAGEAAAADWIAQRLAALGYAVQRQPVPVPLFEPSTCVLKAGDAEVTVWAQAPVTRTEGVTAPLAVLRSIDEAPLARERIALVVLPHGRHASIRSPQMLPLMQAAAAAGARAIVIVPTGPTGEVLGLNCEADAPVVPLPVAVLAPARAEPFLAAARLGLPATLRLQGELRQASSANLIATLRRGPRWIALSTPRTGWFQCASERGTGTAAFLALAAWAARATQHSVFLLNSGAHEYFFAGARRAMELAPAPADTSLWVHLGASLATRDRLEFRGHEQLLPSADSNRTVMASPAMLETVRTAFAGLTGLEQPQPVMTGISELGEIAGHGYERCFAVLGIPRVFHSPLDTLEVVSGELLAPVVESHAAAIRRVLAAEAA